MTSAVFIPLFLSLRSHQQEGDCPRRAERSADAVQSRLLLADGRAEYKRLNISLISGLR
jgi:hypothetical protein